MEDLRKRNIEKKIKVKEKYIIIFKIFKRFLKFFNFFKYGEGSSRRTLYLGPALPMNWVGTRILTRCESNIWKAFTGSYKRESEQAVSCQIRINSEN